MKPVFFINCIQYWNLPFEEHRKPSQSYWSMLVMVQCDLFITRND